jgi:Holliday junction DNA helicase RuvA
MHVREDGVGLYGFLEAAERDLFLLLLEVNGLGPKGALNLLSSYGPGRLKEIIVGGDVSSLVRVSGIGPKLAQRIVLELKDKLARFSPADRPLSPSPPPDEVVAALTALGYTSAEAEAALVEARRTLGNEAGTEELVAHCLRMLDRAGGRDEEEA